MLPQLIHFQWEPETSANMSDYIYACLVTRQSWETIHANVVAWRLWSSRKPAGTWHMHNRKFHPCTVFSLLLGKTLLLVNVDVYFCSISAAVCPCCPVHYMVFFVFFWLWNKGPGLFCHLMHQLFSVKKTKSRWLLMMKFRSSELYIYQIY